MIILKGLKQVGYEGIIRIQLGGKFQDELRYCSFSRALLCGVPPRQRKASG